MKLDPNVYVNQKSDDKCLSKPASPKYFTNFNLIISFICKYLQSIMGMTDHFKVQLRIYQCSGDYLSIYLYVTKVTQKNTGVYAKERTQQTVKIPNNNFDMR